MRLAALLALLVLSPAWARTEVYQDPSLGFSLRYPAEWEMREANFANGGQLQAPPRPGRQHGSLVQAQSLTGTS